MSKAKLIELNVDFIGGVRALAKEDEQAISDYLKEQKLKSKIAQGVKKPKTIRRPKSLA